MIIHQLDSLAPLVHSTHPEGKIRTHLSFRNLNLFDNMSGYQYIEMRPKTDDNGREILSKFQKDLKRQADPKLVSFNVRT